MKFFSAFLICTSLLGSSILAQDLSTSTLVYPDSVCDGTYNEGLLTYLDQTSEG